MSRRKRDSGSDAGDPDHHQEREAAHSLPTGLELPLCQPGQVEHLLPCVLAGRLGRGVARQVDDPDAAQGGPGEPVDRPIRGAGLWTDGTHQPEQRPAGSQGREGGEGARHVGGRAALTERIGDGLRVGHQHGEDHAEAGGQDRRLGVGEPDPVRHLVQSLEAPVVGPRREVRRYGRRAGPASKTHAPGVLR